ncbi:MAG: AraC family transcriptional regulator [Acidobacteria bacterium]|nr:AraC family transcriptional regulator [Acidobacteriota bacterium]
MEVFQGSYRNYQFARHFHRVPAIGVVDSGSMSSYFRGRNHVLGAGTIILLNPGETHAPAPAGTSGWSFRMFYLDVNLFASLTQSCAVRDLRFHKPFVQDSLLASSLLRLHLELEYPGDKLRFESQLLSIFSHLTERYSTMQAPRAKLDFDNTRIDHARQYLEANYTRNPSLKELASLSSFSASHFLRTFRETVGLTPHAYITQLRIEHAASLLRAGIPVVEVAVRAGFVDQSHLTRQFKRILGITPGQYSLHATNRSHTLLAG